MHTLQIDGRHYSVDHAAPRLVLLSAMASTQKAVLNGRAAVSTRLEHDFATVLDDQQAGVHRITAGACSCGLVTDAPRQLGGHLCFDRFDVARTYVVADHRGWWAMACQACRMVSVATSRDDARSRVEHHLCAWDLDRL